MSLKLESASSPESADQIRNFLSGKYSGTLATADAAANPHASVVYFKLEDDFSISFGTKQQTQKYKDIEENKQAAFVVYDEKDQTVVQITGRVEIIDHPDARDKVMNTMIRSSTELSQTGVPPVEKVWAGDYVALRLVPTVVRMLVYARPDSEGDDDLDETLLFSEY